MENELGLHWKNWTRSITLSRPVHTRELRIFTDAILPGENFGKKTPNFKVLAGFQAQKSIKIFSKYFSWGNFWAGAQLAL